MRYVLDRPPDHDQVPGSRCVNVVRRRRRRRRRRRLTVVVATAGDAPGGHRRRGGGGGGRDDDTTPPLATTPRRPPRDQLRPQPFDTGGMIVMVMRAQYTVQFDPPPRSTTDRRRGSGRRRTGRTAATGVIARIIPRVYPFHVPQYPVGFAAIDQDRDDGRP